MSFSVVLLNILLQLTEALICFYFYENITTLGKSNRRILYIILSYGIMTVLTLAFHNNFLINSGALLVFHTLIAHYVYKLKLKFSVVYSLVISLVIAISETIAANFISIVLKADSRSFLESPVRYSVFLVLSKTMLFIFLKIISDIIKKYTQKEKTNQIFLIYPLSLLVVVCTFCAILDENFLSEELNVLVTFTILFLTFSVLITCLFQQSSEKNDAELYELKAAAQKEEIEKTYFELLEKQNEELQLFVHDTKNHLSNLYIMADEPENAKEYIKSFVKNIDSSNQIGKSSNKLLDLIIRKYCLLCEKRGISFERNIHRSNLDFIDDTDLTSLLNNLLDNAVEAAGKSEKKYISLGINDFSSMVHINVNNSCDTKPISNNGILISQKEDKGSHGYGHKSILRTVKKYSGDLHWDYEEDDREFAVSIIFPAECD